MIPVNVITGFLGSGKTTLLKEILRHPDFSDAAVIVNEFGEVGLDHILLEQVEEGVLLLENGCVCCTIRSDLQQTIRALQDNVAAGQIEPFRRVFIETTGLADPSPIVSTLLAEPVIRNHFRVGNILCTVDAVTGLRALEQQPEAVKQIAVADRILITKSDLADEPATDLLENEVRRLNPFAPTRRTIGSGFEASSLFARDVGTEEGRAREVADWFENTSHSHGHQHDHSNQSGSARAFTIEFANRIDWAAFGIWLTALLHAHGERILRVKGILNVHESQTPVVIHGVQHMVHPPLHLVRWPDESRKSRLVFITRGIEEARIRASLKAFLALAERMKGGTEIPAVDGVEYHG
ncbi:GTP-binding protein [Hoeflea sp. TYP-13]|uniref:GTP-binding protein n=1 Tax=Hoeflea sp. TYP-13 TaxID=3230023 RepID=UPI0034C5D150